jgi:hypothetical protein
MFTKVFSSSQVGVITIVDTKVQLIVGVIVVGFILMGCHMHDNSPCVFSLQFYVDKVDEIIF